jgi:hypothetical protein
MKKLFHFAYPDGGWDYILTDLKRLVQLAKEGKISVLDAKSITVEEGETLWKEGFSLIPDDHPVVEKILRIEKS